MEPLCEVKGPQNHPLTRWKIKRMKSLERQRQISRSPDPGKGPKMRTLDSLPRSKSVPTVTAPGVYQRSNSPINMIKDPSAHGLNVPESSNREVSSRGMSSRGGSTRKGYGYGGGGPMMRSNSAPPSARSDDNEDSTSVIDAKRSLRLQRGASTRGLRRQQTPSTSSGGLDQLSYSLKSHMAHRGTGTISRMHTPTMNQFVSSRTDTTWSTFQPDSGPLSRPTSVKGFESGKLLRREPSQTGQPTVEERSRSMVITRTSPTGSGSTRRSKSAHSGYARSYGSKSPQSGYNADGSGSTRPSQPKHDSMSSRNYVSNTPDNNTPSSRHGGYGYHHNNQNQEVDCSGRSFVQSFSHRSYGTQGPMDHSHSARQENSHNTHITVAVRPVVHVQESGRTNYAYWIAGGMLAIGMGVLLIAYLANK